MSKDVAEVKVHDNVVEMAKQIKSKLEIDDKAGVIHGGSDIYEAMLPEDLDIKTVKKVSDHNALFVAAGMKAVGSTAVELLTKNKSLDRVEGKLQMQGRSHVEYTTDRVHESRNPSNGETTTSYGRTVAKLSVAGGKNSGGQLKAVRAELADAARKAFGK